MRYLVALVAILVCATQAAAKEGVAAHLENPGVLHAAAGTKVVVIWTLRDADKHPFGASGIYVRLHGRSTTSALATELTPGRYRARVAIPHGGVRSIVIALKAWSSGPQGTHRGDWRLPIDNDPSL